MILLIQLIFINDNNTFSRWRNSFNSIQKYIIDNSDQNKSIYNSLSILISGFVHDRFVNLVTNMISNINFKFYTDNIGKSSIINDIINNNKYDEYKYNIFMDSDIILEYNTIPILYKLFINNDFFNILLPNQKNDIRHNIKNIKNTCIIDDYNILYNIDYNPNSFAGGMFIINRNILQQFKFDIFGVYGPDDTYFFKKIHDNKYNIGIIENIYVIHPFDINNEYNDFKKNTLIKYLS